MYKLYKRTILNDNPQKGNIIKHDFNGKNIKVGLYNLRYINLDKNKLITVTFLINGNMLLLLVVIIFGLMIL